MAPARAPVADKVAQKKIVLFPCAVSLIDLGHSNWIISFPLSDVTTSMRAGGLLLLSHYSPDI